MLFTRFLELLAEQGEHGRMMVAAIYAVAGRLVLAGHTARFHSPDFLVLGRTHPSDSHFPHPIAMGVTVDGAEYRLSVEASPFYAGWGQPERPEQYIVGWHTPNYPLDPERSLYRATGKQPLLP